MGKYILKLFWLLFVCALLVALPLRASAAVTISSFDAKWQSGKVVVSWKTASELSNVGFNILRSTSPNGTFTKVSYTPAQLGNIAGASYSFTDTTATAGQTYYYQLESINSSNATQRYSGTAIASAGAAATATLTRAPTATATNVPGAPTNTPAPQFTPTRTPTYPPGVTPPTATATSLRVAAAQATPTTARVGTANSPARTGAANPAASPSIGAGTPGATQVALAPQKPTPEDSTAEAGSEDESGAAPQSAGDARGQWLVRGGVIVIGGLFGVGALGCAIIAFLLVRRFNRPEE